MGPFRPIRVDPRKEGLEGFYEVAWGVHMLTLLPLDMVWVVLSSIISYSFFSFIFSDLATSRHPWRKLQEENGSESNQDPS